MHYKFAYFYAVICNFSNVGLITLLVLKHHLLTRKRNNGVLNADNQVRSDTCHRHVAEPRHWVPTAKLN